jgi:hypothetical protein
MSTTTRELVQVVFNNYQEVVEDSFPSIFTKQDVSKIIKEIGDTIDAYLKRDSEVAKKDEVVSRKDCYTIPKDRMDKLLERIQSEICDSIDQIDASDIVDDDDISLEINYSREISVEIESINYQVIKDAVENGIEEFRSVWEEEMKELEEGEETSNDENNENYIGNQI